MDNLVSLHAPVLGGASQASGSAPAAQPPTHDGVAAPRPAATREIGIIAVVFLAYKTVRFIVRDEAATAYANARDVIGFERSMNLFVEPEIQSWFMKWRPAIEALNWFYARIHLVSTAAVLLVLFFVDKGTYTWLRRRLVAVTALALVVHVIYPLAPPRLVGGSGMIDSLQRFGPAIYAHGSALSRMANPYAAMPSLHFGYALLIAWALVRSPVVPAGRWLFGHPFVMLVAIVATANHYWLDALVCVMLIAVVEAGMNWHHGRARAREIRQTA